MALRIRLTLIILCTGLLSHAQLQVALFGGPQATSAHYTVKDTKQPTDFKYGVMAGAGLKVAFENQLYFFPAMYYSLKGYKVTLNNPAFPPTEYAKNNNTTIHTIEIAPLLQVDFSKKPSHLFVRFGPSVDFAIMGREKFDTADNGHTGTIDRNMVFSFDEYGRFTASGIIHFGYETKKGFMIFAHYAYGIGSLNNADDGPTILHRIFGLSVGWLITPKPKVRRR
jgi:hypothetical protein